MRMPILVSIILILVSIIFLVVGIALFRSSVNIQQETARIKSLPLLNAAQLQNTPAGTEAVIEGQIAERNDLYENGFVAYIRSQYQGERCTRDDDGHDDCESIWIEDERITPPLWLDLPDSRAQIAQGGYQIQSAPITWQTPERLIEHETYRYEGFKIGSPVFAKGTVASGVDGPAFAADFIYGSNRATYLSDRQFEAQGTNLGGYIFSGFGLAGIIGGGVLIFIGFK